VIEIKPARVEDAPRLTAIAMAAKAHWGYPKHWLERWEPSLTIYPEYIRANQVVTAILNQSLVGFYSLIGTPPRLELDQLWVYPSFIGKGIGKVLYTDAVKRAVELGAQELQIESDPHAEGFYLHMGARRIGEYVYELDGEPRVLPKLLVSLLE